MKKQKRKLRKGLVTGISILMNVILLAGFVTGVFRPERIVEKEVTVEKTIVPDNVLFVGDSLTAYYDLEASFGDLPVVKSGVVGNTTTDLLADMKTRIYDYNPSVIFLCIGTNDLRDGNSADSTIYNIETIVEEIQENRPHASIILESLYPINEEVDPYTTGLRTNEDINTVNAALEEYAGQNQITYVNVHDSLTDDNGRLKEEYTVDGLHLSDAGYAVVTNVLKEYIE